jgi:hypothetical protein
MRNDIRNWTETETESERKVEYETSRARITVHIPKRTPAQKEQYEKRVKAALRQFYHSVTAQGIDWDTVTARKEKRC